MGNKRRGKSILWKLTKCAKIEKVIANCFTLRYETRIKGKISGLWDKSLKYEFIEPDKLETLFGFVGKPFQKPQQIMLFPLKYRNPVLVLIRLHRFVCLSLPHIAISLFFYLYLHFRTYKHTQSFLHTVTRA